MRYFYAPNLNSPTLKKLGPKFVPIGSFAGTQRGIVAVDESEAYDVAQVSREISEEEFQGYGGVIYDATTEKRTIRESLTVQTKAERQQRAMNETSKAMRRRRCEEAGGGFKWSKVFTGKGIDVGAGQDPIQLPGCTPFDMEDGDANHLSRYVEKESLDYIHGSQVLEHLHNPKLVLLDWSTCLKAGGHIVISIPDYDLYEHCIFPSRFNPDHKTAWSMWRRAHPKCSALIHLPTFLEELSRHGLKTLFSRLVDTNYNYLAPASVDQTLDPDNAEAFLEFVLQKA